MADDWKPGDLALCLRGPSRPPFLTLPGQVFTVTEAFRNAWNERVLFFEDMPREGVDWLGYLASRFRKIHPHTPDAEDAETIRLLTGKPVRVRA